MKKQSKPKPSLKTIAANQQDLSDKVLRLDSKIDATRQELNNRLGFMAAAIQNNEADIKNLQETLDTKVATKSDIHHMIDTIDGFVKRLETQENRSWTNLHRIGEVEPKIENHEKRISALESGG